MAANLKGKQTNSFILKLQLQVTIEDSHATPNSLAVPLQVVDLLLPPIHWHALGFKL